MSPGAEKLAVALGFTLDDCPDSPHLAELLMLNASVRIERLMEEQASLMEKIDEADLSLWILRALVRCHLL